MDQKKVDQLIRKTFEYLAEVLDEEQEESVPESAMSRREKNIYALKNNEVIENKEKSPQQAGPGNPL